MRSCTRQGSTFVKNTVIQTALMIHMYNLVTAIGLSLSVSANYTSHTTQSSAWGCVRMAMSTRPKSLSVQHPPSTHPSLLQNLHGFHQSITPYNISFLIKLRLQLQLCGSSFTSDLVLAIAQHFTQTDCTVVQSSRRHFAKTVLSCCTCIAVV